MLKLIRSLFTPNVVVMPPTINLASGVDHVRVKAAIAKELARATGGVGYL
jgi:hypothetical protein